MYRGTPPHHKTKHQSPVNKTTALECFTRIFHKTPKILIFILNSKKVSIPPQTANILTKVQLQWLMSIFTDSLIYLLQSSSNIEIPQTMNRIYFIFQEQKDPLQARYANQMREQIIKQI